MAYDPNKSSLVDTQALVRAMVRTEEVSLSQGVQIALAGGLAMQVYGSPRLTADVDVLSPQLLFGKGKPLEFHGCLSGERVKIEGVFVDVIVRGDEYQDMYEEARQTAVESDAAPMPVVQPEFLALMKIEAGRAKDESDLAFLILNDLLDLEKTRRLIRTFLGRLAVKEFSAFIEEVRWKASRGLL